MAMNQLEIFCYYCTVPLGYCSCRC